METGAEIVEINGSGSFAVPAVGEQAYLHNFERIFGKRNDVGVDQRCVALLVPEPSNPHDKNAVQVLINSLLVGYLERQSAKNVSESLRRFGRPGIVLKVQAIVRGGWHRSESDKGEFGVWLDFPSETLKSKTKK